MTLNDGFDRTVSDWLDEQAGRGAPDYLDEVLARTTSAGQRPWWSSPERWLPVDIAFRARTASIPRVIWALALLGILVLATALVLIVGGQRHPPHLGWIANGHIAFVDGSLIRFAEADGTIAPVVAAVPNGAEQLTFSPDGTRLAYSTIDGSNSSIFIADENGSNPVAVVTDANIVEAARIAWSPDSLHIAFVVVDGDVPTIDVTDADGTHLARLIPSSGAPAYDPAWSPDGQWISFLSSGVDPDTVALNVIHPDGTGRRPLTTSPIHQEGVAWSPDPGRLRLAYIATDDAQQRLCSSQGCGTRHAFVMVYDLAERAETRLIQTSIAQGFPLTWAPDGRRIARWDESSSHFSVVDVLTGREVTSFPAVPDACQNDPATVGRAICAPARWSPDGQWLYGLDSGGTAIVFVRTDGTSSSHAITLDHPASVEGWQAAWQAVTP